MAGGKGSRMNLSQEKLLLEHKKPIILHVIDAMIEADCFTKVIALTSPSSPKTRSLLKENNIEIFDTSGNGYAEDLNSVLQVLSEPVMIASGDLPLLDSEIIKKIVEHYDPNNIWTSILVTKNFLESLHLSCDFSVLFEKQHCYYTGISLINAKQIPDLTNIKENFIIINDKKIAFNLNTKHDYDLLNSA